jgi:hypothetical protein
MPRVIKQFPGQSVDNPALMGQFACTLKERYVEMFPARRGFAVEFADRTSKKSPSWEIQILHGMFGGTKISIRPSIFIPQQVWVTVSATSRFERRLLKVAVWLALLMMVPFYIAAKLQGSSIAILLIITPMYFIVALILGTIAMLIGRLFGRLDHHFDPGLRRRILAAAGDVPLPDTLQRPETPVTVSSIPPSSFEALPKRSSPWPFTN